MCPNTSSRTVFVLWLRMLFLLGLVWAVTAPLLTSMLLIGLARLSCSVFKIRVSRKRLYIATLLAFWIPLLLVHMQQRHAFEQRMQEYNVVSKSLDHIERHIYLDSPTAGSFGSRYMTEGFTVDYRPYPTEQKLVQSAQKSDGSITTQTIAQSVARAKIIELHASFDAYSIMQYKAFYDDQLIAQSAIGHFQGSGMARWSLGAWGTYSYPAAGSDSWLNAYYLGCTTFLKKSASECAKR